MSATAIDVPLARVRARPNADGVVAALGGFAPVAGLGLAHGGYYPPAWGWAAVSLACAAFVAVLVRGTTSLSRLELTTLGALAALCTWTFASYTWSLSPTQTMLEGQRTLLYVIAVAALLVALRRHAVGAALGGTLAAVTVVCSWALLVRLLPDRLSTGDPFGGGRLSGTIGYWNGLGIFAAAGMLLAIALAARGTSGWRRALAGAPLPILACTAYFTFGRGAWFALAGGLAVAVALDPRRAQFVLTAFAVGAPAAAAVALAVRAEALADPDVSLAAAAAAGHSLLPLVAALAILSGVAAAVAGRFEPGIVARRTLAAAAVAAAAAAVAIAGVSGASVSRALDEFSTQTAPTHNSLNERFTSFSGSGRVDLWRAALDDARAHPLLGSGAGSFEQHWLRERPGAAKVRDAHNLYLETLAELGPLGLVLLLVALCAPLAAASRARAHPLVPGAAAAYAAVVAHAAIDWDWELPAVMLIALTCAGAVLVVARGDRPDSPRPALAAAALAVAGTLAFIGLLGNVAIARSAAAAAEQRWTAAEREAERATRVAPWSAEAWRRRALAQPSAVRARPLFLEAIERDPRNWVLWLELAWASDGAQRDRALREAERLNPLSPEIEEFRERVRRGR